MVESAAIWVALELMCWAFGTMFYITSMATKYWKSLDINGQISLHYNLFEVCAAIPQPDEETCHVWSGEGGGTPILATKVLMILGITFAVLGAIVETVCLLRQASKLPRICAVVLVILGGTLVLIAGSVFTNLTNGFHTFAYSFYLAWISGIFYLMAGTFVYLAARSS